MKNLHEITSWALCTDNWIFVAPGRQRNCTITLKQDRKKTTYEYHDIWVCSWVTSYAQCQYTADVTQLANKTNQNNGHRLPTSRLIKPKLQYS